LVSKRREIKHIEQQSCKAKLAAAQTYVGVSITRGFCKYSTAKLLGGIGKDAEETLDAETAATTAAAKAANGCILRNIEAQ
jgi:hypothetical protein